MTAPPAEEKELESQLEELVENYTREPGDQLGAIDERGYFRIVEKATADPNVDARLLDRLGRHYAERFVTPYLKGQDALQILTEVAGLIEIHRRGILRVREYNETEEDAEAVIGFDRLDPDGRHSAPTRFDIAIVKRALESRYTTVRIVPLPSRGLVGEQLHLHLER